MDEIIFHLQKIFALKVDLISFCSSELIYLKRGRTCHPAVGHGTGWVMPMAWLLTNERVRDYGCHSLRAAAEYFNEACAPGARSAEYQDRNEPDYWEHSHMCDLCHGSGGHLCRRNHMEDYFGHTGAFRCLVEGEEFSFCYDFLIPEAEVRI